MSKTTKSNGERTILRQLLNGQKIVCNQINGCPNTTDPFDHSKSKKETIFATEGIQILRSGKVLRRIIPIHKLAL